jgi:hypothetical protein
MQKEKTRGASGGKATLSRYGSLHFKKLAKKRWAKKQNV